MKKLIILFLSVLLLFPACAKEPPDTGTEAPGTEAPGADISADTVVETGKTGYTLIRPENAEPEELEAAQIVFKAFQELYGIRIAFETASF